MSFVTIALYAGFTVAGWLLRHQGVAAPKGHPVLDAVKELLKQRAQAQAQAEHHQVLGELRDLIGRPPVEAVAGKVG